MSKKRKGAAVRGPSARATAGAKAPGKKEWGAIHKKLEVMRDDLMRTVRNKQELEVSGQEVGDEADQAASSLEKEMLFELNDNERAMLDQIEGALRKLDKGNYGLCESCQKPIGRQRIKALPFARYCIACQGSSERAVVA